MAKKKCRKCGECKHYYPRNYDEGYCHDEVDLVVERIKNASKCKYFEEK